MNHVGAKGRNGDGEKRRRQKSERMSFNKKLHG